MTQNKQNGNYRKGFASMSPEKLKEVVLKGGLARKLKAEMKLAPSYSEIGKKGGKVGGVRNKLKPVNQEV